MVDIQFENQLIKITYYNSEDDALTAQNKISFDSENKYLLELRILKIMGKN